jgi:signal transduction histidine kinase
VRTLVAALLVAAALAALTGGWIATGWRSARREAAALERAPAERAARRAAELAGELGARLEELRARESERPYVHYQNLYRDPRGAAEGASVAPSPLAEGPADPLIASHFQIDERGQVSLPTLNEELPELSNPQVLEASRVALAELAAAADQLGPLAAGVTWAGAAGPVVAAAAPARAPEPTSKPRAAKAKETDGKLALAASPPIATKLEKLDPDVYAQNRGANQVYLDVQQKKAAPTQQATQPAAQQAASPPIQQVAPPPGGPTVPPRAAEAAAPRPTPRPTPRPPSSPPPPEVVVVRVSPLTWYDVEIGGAPRLVALRAVDTPDGILGQGFTIGRDAAQAILVERAGELPVALRPGPAAGEFAAALPIAGASLHVAVDPSAELAAAAAAGAALRREVVTGLVPVVALAVACGVLVILLIARAERLARERSRFAAAAAHELRTPLAGLALYGDMLADDLGDPARKADYARRIADEAHRLGRVVGNVLGFTQLERGALAVSPSRGDLAATAREIVERAAPALDHAGVGLRVALPDALPARFDPDAVARIVQNLIDNAEKYGRGRPARSITIAAAARAGAVELSVADDGPGVAGPARRRLFRPFTRGVAGDGPAGLGLGLALSRALARSMGGDLRHADRAPTGSIFTLELPAG